jgi:hypothetical protein
MGCLGGDDDQVAWNENMAVPLEIERDRSVDEERYLLLRVAVIRSPWTTFFTSSSSTRSHSRLEYGFA